MTGSGGDPARRGFSLVQGLRDAAFAGMTPQAAAPRYPFSTRAIASAKTCAPSTISSSLVFSAQ